MQAMKNTFGKADGRRAIAIFSEHSSKAGNQDQSVSKAPKSLATKINRMGNLMFIKRFASRQRPWKFFQGPSVSVCPWTQSVKFHVGA